MTQFSEQDLSCDALLGGRLHLFQPQKGYRAGVDPVFLAASIPARSGQQVLELGCGAGAAILSLAARVPDLALFGVEIQPAYAALARRNAAHNGYALEVVGGDLANLSAPLRDAQFDYVLANPPYFRGGAHSPAADPGRRKALGEETPLDLWFDAGARRLRPRGYLHMIQRVERLPEMISACADRLGSLEVLPLAPRIGRAPDLIILRARKGGKADFRLHAPLILHAGARHERDGESYRPEIQDVLRNGAALCWP
ncbi:methyltransferase [Ruegeria sp. 2205SS24-7]|uniref:tRNA1(Val) (adenine(37)-N6)-methyltransferase n=1 Tax=Ruegeria discodermiae TaxID=3064389 RepID=UPI002741D299|nr:methyltransferase domain-containing protein [Ruegeria sp. 2205SS24-7]MDP5217475.1 methyltransferase [Ruegeria sp. 2205SS24-7]